jgi:hypothetical protein
MPTRRKRRDTLAIRSRRIAWHQAGVIPNEMLTITLSNSK